MLRRWHALVLMMLGAVMMCPRVAQADTGSAHSVSVIVLALDSDDAEEQADALTSALRSRIRASQGWSLTDTTQSLGMLTAALRCPGKPIPADCEQRISEHLKSDRFIFGYVTKGPQPGQVTAEVHLYQKSKPDTIVKESYSDNLKDANDDTLRQKAQHVLERLGGSAVGTIVVKMGNENGEVIVDGEKHAQMQGGVARVDLSPGTHSVEVSTHPGVATQKRVVTVTAGKDTVVDLALQGTEPTGAEPPKESKPFPTRKVVAGGLVGLGIVSGVIGVVFAAKYGSDQSDGKAARDNPGSTNQGEVLPAGKKPDDVCGKSGGISSSAKICQINDDAHTHSALGYTFGGIGVGLIAAGVVIYLTGGHHTEGEAPPPPSASLGPLKNITGTPMFGQNNNGFALSGSF